MRSLGYAIRRALKKQRTLTVAHYAIVKRVFKGAALLKEITYLAQVSDCSVPFLLSGGAAEYNGNLSPEEAIFESIKHAGKELHEAANAIGYRTPISLQNGVKNGAIPITKVKKLANYLNLTLPQLFSDSECEVKPEIIYTPSLAQLREDLALMGWV